MRSMLQRVRALTLTIHSMAARAGAGIHLRTVRLRSEGGQTVAEYALVLLVAAAIAAAFLIWAKQSGRLDEFFDKIFEKLLGSVDSAS
jgi:hypothetical protein